MSRRLTWFLTLPLMVGGLLAGHWLAYRAAIGDAHAREHALDVTGHAYLAYAPTVVAVCLTLVLTALVLRVSASFRGAPRTAPPAAFAVLPLLAFTLQEHLERFVHSGELPWTAALEPTFAIGIAVQLPFAFAALLVAEVLDSLAHAVGTALATAATRRPSLQLPPAMPVAAFPVPRLAVLARGYSGRAPPFAPEP
jgi:hypothetical protein